MSMLGIWRGMLSRCHNLGNEAYEHYGGRGITVCDRWRNSYDAFVVDMGLRPGPEYSLDRIDVNGNYCPENCRWALAKVQANNTRSTKKVYFQGQLKSLARWAVLLEVEVGLLHYTVDDQLVEPEEGFVAWKENRREAREKRRREFEKEQRAAEKKHRVRQKEYPSDMSPAAISYFELGLSYDKVERMYARLPPEQKAAILHSLEEDVIDLMQFWREVDGNAAS